MWTDVGAEALAVFEHFTAESTDGLVRVTANTAGELTDIDLDTDTVLLDRHELARLITATARVAYRLAATHTPHDLAAAPGPRPLDDGGLFDDDDLFAEWQRAIAAADTASHEFDSSTAALDSLCGSGPGAA